MASGCGGDSSAPPLGRQVVAGRDVDISFFWTPDTVAFTRAAANPSEGKPQDVWIASADRPAPDLAVAGVDWQSSGPERWYVEGELLLAGDHYTQLYDLTSRQLTNLEMGFAPPAGGGDQLTINGASIRPVILIRPDGRALVTTLRGTSDTLIVGRPPDLKTVTVSDGHIGAAAFVGSDLALLVLQTVDGKSVVGIERLNVETGALATLVAPTPAQEWIGVTGFCDPTSFYCGQFESFGCDTDQPACPDGGARSCVVVYSKRDPEAPETSATFLYDVARGTNVRLAGRNHDRFSFRRGSHQLVWGSTFESTTHHLDLCTGVEAQCPFSPGDVPVWRADGSGVATWRYGGSFDIVNVTPPSCVPQVIWPAGGVQQLAWLPDGNRLLWVSDRPEGGQTVWISGPNANESAVPLVSGAYLAMRLSPDRNRLFLWRASSLELGSVASLSWLDLTAPSPIEHLLSSNHGSVVAGNRRILMIDHWNTQDNKGELVLLEPSTGARLSLARAVSEVAVGVDVDAEGTNIAYVVRNRGASPRDGLWLAALPP
jgi:hypothetical protein